MNLDHVRTQIDEVDEQLSALFARRLALVADIARVKAQTNKPVLDSTREQIVLERARARAPQAQQAHHARFFAAMMAISRSYQDDLLQRAAPSLQAQAVACLGGEGSYSDQAAHALFGADAQIDLLPSFDAVAQAVLCGRSAYGVLPVENTATGAIARPIDLICMRPLHIVAEYTLRIRHCLAARPGVALGQVRGVYSHAQGIEQCGELIRRMGLRAMASPSTADAARTVAQAQASDIAAITSEQAALACGLVVLQRDIADIPGNATRFAVVMAQPQYPADADKMGLVCILSHTSGSLHALLGCFAQQGINLYNIVARPLPGQSGEYCFYLEMAGALGQPRVDAALQAAQRLCISLRVAGAWRAGGFT